MYKEIDKRFEIIKSKFTNNDLSVDLICKAYEFAKEKHKDQRRKDGGLYISHPVEVALILASLDFDENVVSAALLHDVVEDCDVTIQTIKSMFNSRVAEMVDCVSAIDKARFVYNKEDLFEDVNFEKASIEEQSFKKLIAIGKKNPLGFCIKFADRLHNLKTISTFDYNKQLEKVKETERWIIPIAQALNTEYFYRSIKNECFKIVHKFNGKDYFDHYQDYHMSNQNNIENLQKELNKAYQSSSIKQIKIKHIREYKVFEDLAKIFKNLNVQKVSQGQIIKVANYNIYLIHDGSKKYVDIVEEVLTVLDKRLKNMKIIEARIGGFTHKPYYQIVDKIKNKYNVYIVSQQEYIKQRNGTIDGQHSSLIDDDNLDNMEVGVMRVKTRSGEIKFVPNNSTVLDFAFKLHRDIGFAFDYAVINGSKTKSPPYTKLLEDDKVEIIVRKDENGELKKNPELKWFAYVNTDLSKKYLIKFFEGKLN